MAVAHGHRPAGNSNLEIEVPFTGKPAATAGGQGAPVLVESGPTVLMSAS
jgi:hypothetical protein